MSNFTPIQWADTSVNPIMGCGGCELFPSPREILAGINAAVNVVGFKIDSTRIFKELVEEVFQKSENAHEGHKRTVNSTNIWHLRERFAARIREAHSEEAADAATVAIRKAITCYAAIQHLNKGANILDREGIRPGKDKPREVKEGYAPIFEMVTKFKGRAWKKAAILPDLLGRYNPKTRWKERLPRMIFVSDMGDALSAKGDFQFLKEDLMPAIASDEGRRHLWLWLSKRPGRMAEFADEIGGFPDNLCAMTTLTGPDDESLKRLKDIKRVNASSRGLSIEPLWSRIPPSKLNLTGIDWVILGGESGSGDLTRPFALEWAEELRDHCRKTGTAFFMKQLGRNPTRGGELMRLPDKHGGEWDEWDDPLLRVRQFPKAFHDYRKNEMRLSNEPRPVAKEKKPRNPEAELATPEEKVEFKRLDKIVRRGMAAFFEAGQALLKIHDDKLWRAGGHGTWENYCRSVAGMSKGHAHRLLQASQCVLAMSKTSPIGDVLPIAEAQVRPLLRLAEPEQRIQAWVAAVEKAGGQPTAIEVAEVVFEILEPDGPQERPQTRSEKRSETVSKLRKAVTGRKSWDLIERLINDLEGLL